MTLENDSKELTNKEKLRANLNFWVLNVFYVILVIFSVIIFVLSSLNYYPYVFSPLTGSLIILLIILMIYYINLFTTRLQDYKLGKNLSLIKDQEYTYKPAKFFISGFIMLLIALVIFVNYILGFSTAFFDVGASFLFYYSPILLCFVMVFTPIDSSNIYLRIKKKVPYYFRIIRILIIILIVIITVFGFLNLLEFYPEQYDLPFYAFYPTQVHLATIFHLIILFNLLGSSLVNKTKSFYGDKTKVAMKISLTYYISIALISIVLTVLTFIARYSDILLSIDFTKVNNDPLLVLYSPAIFIVISLINSMLFIDMGFKEKYIALAQKLIEK